MEKPLSNQRYGIRVSHRAKYLRIQVSSNQQVTVIVPMGTSKAVVEHFVTSKQAWIQSAKDKFSQAENGKSKSLLSLPQTIDLKAIGRSFEVIANPSASTCISTLYAKPNNKILLTHPQGDLDGTFGCLRAWVQKLARLHLPVVVNEMAEKHHVEVKKLIIRTQKTRWGSYSNSGTMSLNSKLMFLEKQYVELVILHEMAHMTYHDHSQKFWAHLVSFEPHALELDKHLNKLAREIPVWMHELA